MQILRLDAFTHPFDVQVVGDEILVKSDQAPVEIVFTASSAAQTAARLLEAADQIGRGSQDNSVE